MQELCKLDEGATLRQERHSTLEKSTRTLAAIIFFRMAYFLFVDESGHDLLPSPAEVIAGVAIEDKDLWNFILDIKSLEMRCFGMRYPKHKEIKARSFLTRAVFRKSKRLPDFKEEERQTLAKFCLENGPESKERHIVALEQAKLAYVTGALEICSRFRCKVFATINEVKLQHVSESELLPKNYVYLFERFYYFLESKSALGCLVFDEFDKAQSHLLIERIESYFKKTLKGRQRSSLIIPEPFFVHSDLTTGIQIADFVAYIISWGFRLEKGKAVRELDFAPFVELIKPMRFRSMDSDGWSTWSIINVKK